MRFSASCPRLLTRVCATLLVLGHAAGLSIAPASAAEASDPPARVTFGVDRGCYTDPVRVELRCPTPGATIRYTTNGSLPTAAASGLVYASPLELRRTTILRAVAEVPGRPPGPVETRSYLFLADVPRQDGRGWPTTWGTREGQPVAAAYALSPDILADPRYGDRLLPALRSLPAVSIVAAPDDLFGADRGLYCHPMERGDAWERAASVEWIAATNGPGFGVPCGLRIQGGWNRRPEESPKHAFRVVFRARYGAERLRFPLFDAEGVAEFDSLILRAGCNNTWLHWSGEERRRGDYLRDQWMRDSQAALGWPAARGRFVHVFLNGLYWGLYNLAERPDDAFVSLRSGGRPKDWDVRNADNLISGDDTAWRELMDQLGRNLDSPAGRASLERLLDLPAFADYFLLNLYGANGDWDGASNWYAARRRRPAGPFQFFVWDGERTLEGLKDSQIDFDAADSPPGIFQKLRRLPAFRRLFAERAHRHLGPGGALSPEAAAARFEARAREIDLAIIAESARWGAYRHDLHRYKTPPYERYTRDDHWRPEIDRLLREYFPGRTAEVIAQLKSADLW